MSEAEQPQPGTLRLSRGRPLVALGTLGPLREWKDPGSWYPALG